MQFIYPANLAHIGPDEVVVSIRDLPECLTSGTDTNDALAAAVDALGEALAGRIDDGEPIPSPSTAKPGEFGIAVPPSMAAKAALAMAFRKRGLTPAAFAASMGVDDEVVYRMLDPCHATSLDRIDRALRSLGQRIAVAVDTV